MKQESAFMSSIRAHVFIPKECAQGGCSSLARRSVLKEGTILQLEGVHSKKEQVFFILKCTFSLKVPFSWFFSFFLLSAFVCVAWKKRLVSKSRKSMSSPNHVKDNTNTSKG